MAGNTQLRYKDAMNVIERPRRGPRRSSSSGTWTAARPLFTAEDDAELVARASGAASPPPGRFCAFCRARAQVLGERLPAATPPRTTARSPASSPTRSMPAEIYGSRTGA